MLTMASLNMLRGLSALLLAAQLVGCAESPAGVGLFDLAGTSWSLLSVETPSALLQPSSGAPPTLTFTDETAEGHSGWFRFRTHGGCNLGGGIYRTDERPLDGEASLEVDGFAWTDMACPEPDVMVLEAEYFAVLAEAESVEALAGGLVIRSVDSTLMLEPVPALP
jgi:heat shock protein HslJ